MIDSSWKRACLPRGHVPGNLSCVPRPVSPCPALQTWQQHHTAMCHPQKPFCASFLNSSAVGDGCQTNTQKEDTQSAGFRQEAGLYTQRRQIESWMESEGKRRVLEHSPLASVRSGDLQCLEKGLVMSQHMLWEPLPYGVVVVVVVVKDDTRDVLFTLRKRQTGLAVLFVATTSSSICHKRIRQPLGM